MANEVSICNRALQKLGAGSIVSLTQVNNKSARECAIAYEPILFAELRSHPWNFAIKRARLAADTTMPVFGRLNSFTLPNDWLKNINDFPGFFPYQSDWMIEGHQILTNEKAPLDLRYISKVEDVNLMDALFREAFATSLAAELCEPLTQSNSKKASLQQDYKEIITRARKQNAFEKPPQEPYTDSWVGVRSW